MAQDTKETAKPRLPVRRSWRGSRTPQDSALFRRVLPAAIVFMALITVVLILFAIGVLVGVVPFQ